MKIVINRCFGGFGLSEAAYKWLIAHGVPVRAHIEQKRGKDGLYKPEPKNDGKVIFDRSLTPKDTFYDERHRRLFGRYWDSWTSGSRTDPLLVGVVEALGKKASGDYAELTVIEIPDGVEYEISEYDGMEHIAEQHRTWG